MSKTTFEGYVPSLKARHEATIVGGKAIQSKGGSIRYMLQGEYDGRKTLPKTVSKEDFVKVYGFDAKEAEAVYITGIQDYNGVKHDKKALYHQVGKEDEWGYEPKKIVPIENKDDASDVINEEMDKEDAMITNAIPSTHGYIQKLKSADTVGSPSPADVQPPAPSEKPFPQEPSNENFSAENVRTGITDDGKTAYEWYVVEGDESITDSNGEPLIRPYDEEEITNEIEYYVNHFVGQGELSDSESLRLHEIVDAHDRFDEPMEYTIAYSWKPVEVKEAFGLFGGKEEEKEESDEPKTKEYTVVLQEGDKLELTDLPGDDPEKNEEDKDESEEKDEKEVETYEAVQAKVTRIEDEKEEEDEEEESDEGLLTPKNLAIGALGVGALALVLGAEDESEDESDYWADEGQYTMNAEGFYESSSVSGDVDVGESKRVMGRKDYDISTDYDGDLEIDDIDLDVPEVFEQYEDELIQAVKDDVDYSMPIEDGETGTGSYDVDVEVELPVRVTGNVDFNWTSDLEDEDDHTDDEWASEEVSEIEYDEYLDELGSDALILYKDNASHLFEKAYPIDYEVGMNDYESSLLADIQDGYTENSMMFDEDENLTPYGEKVLKEMYDDLIDQMGIEWLADRHPASELLKRGDPTAYRVGMSEFEDAGWMATFESESDGYTYAYTKGHKDGMSDEINYRPSIPTDKEKTVFKKILRQKAETFEATGQTMYRFTLEDWPLIIHVDGCPLANKGGWDKTYTADEVAQESYMILFEHESLPQFEGNTFGDLRKASGGLILPCNCTINEMKVIKELDPATFTRYHDEIQEHWSDTVGSPSPSGPSSVPEPAEATGSEPSNENFESQDKGNLKLIGGIGLVAAGLFALGKSDWVADMLDKYMK